MDTQSHSTFIASSAQQQDPQVNWLIDQAFISSTASVAPSVEGGVFETFEVFSPVSESSDAQFHSLLETFAAPQRAIKKHQGLLPNTLAPQFEPSGATPLFETLLLSSPPLQTTQFVNLDFHGMKRSFDDYSQEAHQSNPFLSVGMISPNSPSQSSPMLLPNTLPTVVRGTARFKCICGLAFEDMSGLFSHSSNQCNAKSFVCDVCQRGFTRRQDLKRHRLVHEALGKQQSYPCADCGQDLTKKTALKKHKCGPATPSSASVMLLPSDIDKKAPF